MLFKSSLLQQKVKISCIIRTSMLGNVSCFCCRLLNFQNYLFQKILPGIQYLDQDSVYPNLGQKLFAKVRPEFFY